MDHNDPSRSGARPPGQRARRPRAARACDLCRIKKNKCDESYPCSYCKSRDVQCVYQGQQLKTGRFTAEYVKQLEDQIKQLTTHLRHDPADPPATAWHPSMQDDSGSQLQPARTPTSISTVSSRQAGEADVSGVNRHTHDIEYYGSSSSVALLSHIQRADERSREEEDGGHLVSSLHNPAFRARSTAGPSQNLQEGADIGRVHHDPRFRGFLESFFSSIHYIHPILDKGEFIQRCETLWSGSTDSGRDSPSSSFVALYYSVLSLGAVVRVRDEELLGGQSNLHWSRKFFDISRTYCNQLGLVTDLEMVQCYFFMAKVCQNELNPHSSYMYVGLAVRTALAMGANRDPGVSTKKDASQIRAESRTWWGLYSLETEIAFAIGRPDTLGADVYHNRQYPLIRTSAGFSGPLDDPLLEPPHCNIINCMVEFSRITRIICQKIYLSNASVVDIITLTNQIEKDLDSWLGNLPDAIRPPARRTKHQQSSLRRSRDPQWVKRQRLVLNIRYHNLRILLFGYLLVMPRPSERLSVPQCKDNILKCLDSAKETISIIYETYEHSDFFQTWFYNTTYTVFAASVILLYVSQGSTSDEESVASFQFVDMAIEILEIMSECVAALEAAKLLRRAKGKAESRLVTGELPVYDQDAARDAATETNVLTPLLTHAEGQSFSLNNYWGPLGFLDENSMDFDMTLQFETFDPDIPTILA